MENKEIMDHGLVTVPLTGRKTISRPAVMNL